MNFFYSLWFLFSQIEKGEGKLKNKKNKKKKQTLAYGFYEMHTC